MLTVMGHAAYSVVEADGRNAEMGDVVDEKLSGQRLNYSNNLQSYLEECKHLNLPATTQRTIELIGKITNTREKFYWVDSKDGIDGILRAAYKELNNIKFAFVPEEKHDFFENDKNFGALVWIAFPSAREDTKSAGNCLAVGLDTAAVFHSMRIVEHGIRALAKHLGLKIKNRTLETADWSQLIKGISEVDPKN